MRYIKSFMLFVVLIAGIAIVWKIDMGIVKLRGNGTETKTSVDSELEKVKTYIDDTAIIRNAFKSVGVLGLMEGNEQYRQQIEEETWYSYRSIDVDWQYRFSIAVNLDDLGVEVKDDVVSINVNKSKIFIWFIEKTSDSKSTSYASWFALKYSAREIELLEKAVVEKIRERIEKTEKYWTEAQASLEQSLVKLCNELGYSNIRFIYAVK